MSVIARLFLCLIAYNSQISINSAKFATSFHLLQIKLSAYIALAITRFANYLDFCKAKQNFEAIQQKYQIKTS